MKLSLSGRLVEINANTTAMPVGDFLRLAAQTGYDAVDLRGSQLNPETPVSLVAEIKATLAEFKLEVFAGSYGGKLVDRDEEKRFVAFAETLAGLNAFSIRLGAPPETLKRAARLVAPLGLNIYYQMHTNSPFETIDGAAEVIAEINEPNFGLAPEPANLALAGLPFHLNMFDKLRGGMVGAHVQTLIVCGDGEQTLTLRDGRKVRYTRVPYAENSQIPFALFFQALKHAGFDGYINELEPYPADGDCEAVAAEAARFLRSVMG